MSEALGSLKNPPIVEVICGIHFDELPGLDAMLVGQFWSGKRDVYAKREMKAPVRDIVGLTVTEGPGPIRCWLVSKEDEWVIQIQPDRFYFNWRRRGGAYPRFGDHEGKKGVLSIALGEFEEFALFCEKELSALSLTRVELAKIDDVVFDNLESLGSDLPLVAAIMPWTKSGTPEINVRIAEQVGDVDVLATLSNAMVTPDLRPAVRVETRATQSLGFADPRSVFVGLNIVLNKLFAQLFSKSAIARFKGVPS